MRHCARAVSAIAKIDLPANQWPDLLPFIYQQCCQNQQSAAMREVGYYQVFALLDVLVEGFKQHVGQLLALLRAGLMDAESKEVKTNALKYIHIYIVYSLIV